MQGILIIMGDSEIADGAEIEVHVAVEPEVTPMPDTINKIEALVRGKASKISSMPEDEARIILFEAVVGYQQQTQIPNPNHYRPPPMGH